MKRYASGLLFVFVFSCAALAQAGDLQTVELLSPLGPDGRHDAAGYRRSCFSFVSGKADCRASDIYYGGVRAGDDWDWFQARGAGERNRIESLGKKAWTDEIKIPVVEPYAALKSGEQRRIVWDLSGKDGADGLPGLSRGESGSPDVFPDSTADVARVNANPRRVKEKSDYHPYEKAVAGRMYVLRVVDESHDFYVLFRVDGLERGKRCRISWKKIDAPKAD
jgi:hypothetical protein